MAWIVKSGVVRLVLLLILMCSSHNVRGLELLFSEDDFLRLEDNSDNMITIIKADANEDPVTVSINFFTESQFAAMNGNLPIGVTIEDPAEANDFDPSPVTFTIAPSPNEMQMDIPVTFVVETVNEAAEGFVATFTIDDISTTDMMNLVPSTRPVAVVVISNDDNIEVGFSITTFTVIEGNSIVSGDVNVGILNGGMTEQNLEYTLTYSVLAGASLDDFSVISPPLMSGSQTVTTIMLDATTTTIEVTLDTIEDDIVEPTELFDVILAVPANPLPGVSIGSGQGILTISIEDNDVAIVGFNNTVYRRSEGSGLLTVVYGILSPNPVTVDVFPFSNFITVNLMVLNGTATNPPHYSIVLINTLNTLFATFESRMLQLQIEEDNGEINEDREFFLQLVPGSPSTVDFEISPSMATVIIEDNDGLTISPNPSLTVNEGDSVSITCQPIPQGGVLMLLVNGQPTTASSTDMDNSRIFNLGPANRNDDGNIFQCISGNSTSLTTTLQVNFPPIYTVTSPVTVAEGSTNFQVMLDLSAGPIPVPPDGSFSWTVNGMGLMSGMGGVTLGVDSIEFASVTRDMDGNTYEVTGTNVAGTGMGTFVLSVLFPPEYMVQESFTVNEGETLQVLLNLTANPLPMAGMFNWFFNGDPLMSSSDLMLEVDSISFVAGINRNQAGTYLVEAMNSVGNDSASFMLEVFFPPEYTVNNTFTVSEGDPFSIQLGLTGNPLPVDSDTSWFVNGQPLTMMGGIDFGTDFISIPIVTRLDEGTYMVTTSNTAGPASASFQLIVEIPEVTTDAPVTMGVSTNNQPMTTPEPLVSTVSTDMLTAAPATTDDPNSGTGGQGGGGDQGTGGANDGGSMGGDPHFSIILPTGQPLCFSVQGEHGFTFNLVNSPRLNINARFDQDARRSEVTWIGSLGVVAKTKRAVTKIRFESLTKSVYIGSKSAMLAKNVQSLVLNKGKLKVSEVPLGTRDGSAAPEVKVEIVDIGIVFVVRFIKSHLDMVWQRLGERFTDAHGMLGQFFRPGVEVDETRRLLELPNMDPVPVMRKPIWHFMERETSDDKLCWVAMNPGYQGKHLIEGHFLDYLVDDVLSPKFKFKAGRYNKLMNLLKKK